MKQVFILIWVILLFLLVSCSNNQPAIEKAEAKNIDDHGEPELVEETVEEVTQEYIEFYLDNEQITVNLEMIPILKAYLNANQSPEELIRDMKLERILTENDELFLLSFACKETRCSHILLKQDKNTKTHLLTDISKFSTYILSPDESKILFVFHRDSTTTAAPLTHMILMDLDKWEKLPLYAEGLDTVNRLLNFQKPLNEIIWIDDESISVSLTTTFEDEIAAGINGPIIFTTEP